MRGLQRHRKHAWNAHARLCARNCKFASFSLVFSALQYTLAHYYLKREKRLHEKKVSLGPLSTQQAALCMEKLLYKQYSGDLTEYADVSTLSERLAPILQRLMTRKDHATEILHPEESRKRLLRTMLGKPRYWKALLLSKEIRRLRLQHASLGCASCNSDGVCQLQPDIKGMLPQPVQTLFFRVSLLNFFETASEDEIASSSLETWDTMIQESEDALHQYKQWRALINPFA